MFPFFHLPITGRKLFFIVVSVSALTACSSQISRTGSKKTSVKTTQTSADRYAEKQKTALLGNSVNSSGNTCVDHFNFIKSSHSNDYTRYSKEYGSIGEGYRFLSVNKDIMDKDARNVYTMSLDMKLNTLCTKVQYSGYLLIKEKINNLASI